MAGPPLNWETRIGRRLKLRDLHILATVVHWGSMARGATHLGMSQPAVSEAIANLESALRENAKVSSPLTVGTVVSGDWYIRTSDHKRRIWDRFKAQSVDWESASVARVSDLCGVPWLSIRVVSDLAEEDMAKEYSENVVRVLRELAPAFLEALAETGGV